MILLQDSPLQQSDKEAMELILFKCKQYFDIMDITKQCRESRYVECKRMAVWYISQYTDCNVYHIAKALGLSRPTVIHHLNKVVDLINTKDGKTLRAMNYIGSQLSQLV